MKENKSAYTRCSLCENDRPTHLLYRSPLTLEWGLLRRVKKPVMLCPKCMNEVVCACDRKYQQILNTLVRRD